MKRIFKIIDESNDRHGPCFVVRERIWGGSYGHVWEWNCWCLSREEAEKHASGLGELVKGDE